MISVVAVTPDNRYIIGGDADSSVSGRITFWDFKTGSLVRVDKWKHSYLEFILAAPDSRTIVVSGRDDNYFRDGVRYIVAGDIETASYQTIRAGYDFPLHISFSWDKQRIKFGDYAWNWQSGGDPYMIRKKAEYDGRLHPKVIELAPACVLTSDDETYYLKDIRSKEIVRKLNAGHNNKFHALTPIKVSMDNRYFFAQRGSQDTKDEILWMWDLQTGALMKSFKTCKGRIHSIDITSDNRFIVAAIGFEPSSAIIVVNVETDEVVLKIAHEQIHVRK